jgi:ATP-dependent DNA ligase
MRKVEPVTPSSTSTSALRNAFDLLHLEGWDVTDLQLIEREPLLESLLAGKPGLQFNCHETGDGGLILSDAWKLLRGCSLTRSAPYSPGNRGSESPNASALRVRRRRMVGVPNIANLTLSNASHQRLY